MGAFFHLNFNLWCKKKRKFNSLTITSVIYVSLSCLIVLSLLKSCLPLFYLFVERPPPPPWLFKDLYKMAPQKLWLLNPDVFSVNSPDLLLSNSIVITLEIWHAKIYVWLHYPWDDQKICQAAKTCPEKQGTFPILDFIKQCLGVFERICPSENHITVHHK